MIFRLSSKPAKKTDQELLLQYRAGKDMASLGELYNRYIELVYGVCFKYLKNREESQDAVMQLFEKLAQELEKSPEIQNFKTWLYVVTKNFCLMQLRAKSAHKHQAFSESLLPEDMEKYESLHPTNEELLENNLSALDECLKHLKEEQKKCVELFYLKQKCYQDITQDTGYELKKVKSYIQNGKRNLKICMENHKGE
ncbi:sigma-70 family RNA polymerase sigma factor [Rapidithrix thailandica]|uniref:Sigma-70 family RNA polymerase sigma factor n=1 Tax=Rapidithrix thailandica TaxID=413964 RepID=A0AAW9RXU7_9BACT